MSTKIDVICAKCGESFKRSKASYNEAVKLGSKQFCGPLCLKSHRTTALTVQCSSCSTEIKVLQGVYTKSESKNFFCNRSCAASFNNRKRTPYSEDLRNKISSSCTSFYNSTGHNTVSTVCGVCSTPYTVQQARFQKGIQKHCSSNCAHYAKTGEWLLEPDEIRDALIAYYTTQNCISSKIVSNSLYHQSCRTFGTWNEALLASGIPLLATSPVSKKNHLCLDGHTADSAEEAYLDNWLYTHSVYHERTRVYPGTKMNCDFYIPSHNLWVEYLGMYMISDSYRKRFAIKEAIGQSQGFSVIGILAEDLRRMSSGLERKLSFLNPAIQG